MTGPPLRRDPAEDVGRLRAWHGLPPGPAGLLTTAPVAGLVVVFDAADLGRLVEVQVDTAAVSGGAAAAVGVAVDALEWAAEPSEVLRVLGRRALLDALATDVPLAAVDDALLALDLPEPLRPVAVDDTVTRAAGGLLAVSAGRWRQASPALLEDAARAAQRLADPLWQRDSALAARVDALALELFETAERRQQPHQLRRASAPAAPAAAPADIAPAIPMAAMAAPEVREQEPSTSIRVLVDDRVADAAGIDSDSMTATLAGHALTVSVRVVGDLGPAWARAWDVRTETLLATGRLFGTPHAEVRLPIPPGSRSDHVAVDVADDPRSPRVTMAAVRLADAFRAGWDAAAAERLGSPAATEQWRAAAGTWAVLGDADRRALAMDYAQSAGPAEDVTWAQPLLGQPRFIPPAFLHERLVADPAPPSRWRRDPSGGWWDPPPHGH